MFIVIDYLFIFGFEELKIFFEIFEFDFKFEDIFVDLFEENLLEKIKSFNEIYEKKEFLLTLNNFLNIENNEEFNKHDDFIGINNLLSKKNDKITIYKTFKFARRYKLTNKNFVVNKIFPKEAFFANENNNEYLKIDFLADFIYPINSLKSNNNQEDIKLPDTILIKKNSIEEIKSRDSKSLVEEINNQESLEIKKSQN